MMKKSSGVWGGLGRSRRTKYVARLVPRVNLALLTTSKATIEMITYDCCYYY